MAHYQSHLKMRGFVCTHAIGAVEAIRSVIDCEGTVVIIPPYDIFFVDFIASTSVYPICHVYVSLMERLTLIQRRDEFVEFFWQHRNGGSGVRVASTYHGSSIITQGSPALFSQLFMN